MVKINILKKGDEVISVTDNFLAVKRKNGGVDIFRVMMTEENEFCIDPVKVTSIGYGTGTVSKDLDDGNTTVYSF